MEGTRLCAVNIVIGAPGTGKTSLIKGIIAEHPKRVLIIGPPTADFQQYEMVTDVNRLKAWKSGVKRLPPVNFSRTIVDFLVKNARDMMLVLEDSSAYMPDNIDIRFKDLMTMRRHNNLDFIFVYHAFNLVQPKIYQMSNYITVFKTPEDENYVRKLNKIPNQDMLIRAVQTIRRLQDAEKHLPKPKDPWHPKKGERQYDHKNITIPTMP